MMKSEFKKAGTLQLTAIRRIDGELLCVTDAGADAADGYLWRSMWILWITSLSSHSTSASVSERSRLVTIQLYSRQNAIVKIDPSLTVSRFKRYLNDTGIAVFKKFIS